MRLPAIRDSRRFGFVLLGGAFILLAAQPAFSDSFLVTHLSPGVQTPSSVTPYYETFNSLAPNTALTSPFVTNFGGSAFTGTYTGAINWRAANGVGGAGGTGVFPLLSTGNSYSLSLDTPVNYFGLWLSALDPGNQLQFYNGSNLLYTFTATPTALQSLLGACPAGAFCGNPNSGFAGDDPGEPFAYLSFYDATAAFTEVVFSEVGTHPAGFESDNQAVAILAAPPVETVPEPANAVVLGGAGLAAALLVLRKKGAKKLPV
jgi:hypothetical protein